MLQSKVLGRDILLVVIVIDNLPIAQILRTKTQEA